MTQTDEFIKEFSKDSKFKRDFEEADMRTEAALAVRSLREQLGLTQAEFAELVGKPQSTISRIETEEMNPTFKLLEEIGAKTNRRLNIKYV
ncbi:helix-turn-helix transcriptional regulator [Fructilactobacillus cliffordii]|uniref:Helix-turn-helix domain-containing protein n=1 Tax=Fructilactobacillus cliffordii TaxID=2940299 RepID=A0A9Q8ZTC3_9LACO|nr:helix-turn-helix transcriptional regulator [Fructilactobacillus cliffordii]USS86314.1 helix-turn-helix domain-containing protein [Fructilactobacillus cliffordii]USS89383.1 helix-turn-helix domain-containing protein [Fructilactobacillus cliffordii]